MNEKRPGWTPRIVSADGTLIPVKKEKETEATEAVKVETEKIQAVKGPAESLFEEVKRIRSNAPENWLFDMSYVDIDNFQKILKGWSLARLELSLKKETFYDRPKAFCQAVFQEIHRRAREEMDDNERG